MKKIPLLLVALAFGCATPTTSEKSELNDIESRFKKLDEKLKKNTASTNEKPTVVGPSPNGTYQVYTHDWYRVYLPVEDDGEIVWREVKAYRRDIGLADEERARVSAIPLDDEEEHIDLIYRLRTSMMKHHADLESQRRSREAVRLLKPHFNSDDP